MLRPKVLYLSLSALLLLMGCNTGFHGSFAPNTYFSNDDYGESQIIGTVEGLSCQTRVLYIFPLGSAPSTAEAIQAAKNQYEDTKFLTDISIDDRTKWEVGYSIQCITVEGIAHQ